MNVQQAKKEVDQEVAILLEKKFEQYEQRYEKPNEATIRKWRRRAVALVEMRKFQLSLFPPDILAELEAMDSPIGGSQ